MRYIFFFIIIFSSCVGDSPNTNLNPVSNDEEVPAILTEYSDYSEIPLTCVGIPYRNGIYGSSDKKIRIYDYIKNDSTEVRISFGKKNFYYGFDNYSGPGFIGHLYGHDSDMILLLDYDIEYGHWFEIFKIAEEITTFIADTSFPCQVDENELEVPFDISVAESEDSIRISLGPAYEPLYFSTVDATVLPSDTIESVEDLRLKALEKNCAIPAEVTQYLLTNSDDWSRLSMDDYYFDKVLNSIDGSSCPYYLFGDFNSNGKEDLALLVKSIDYNPEKLSSIIVQVLLIFNDYEDGHEPIEVIRSEIVQNLNTQPAIFESNSLEVPSIISGKTICDHEIIELIGFENTGSLVYWNKELNKYQYIKEGDFPESSLCDLVSNKNTILGNWFVDCEYSLANLSIHKSNVLIEVNFNEVNISCRYEKESDYIYHVYLESLDMLDDSGMEMDLDNYSKDIVIAKMEFLKETNQLKFNWIGLYNSSTNERELVEDIDVQSISNQLKDPVMRRCY